VPDLLHRQLSTSLRHDLIRLCHGGVVNGFALACGGRPYADFLPFPKALTQALLHRLASAFADFDAASRKVDCLSFTFPEYSLLTCTSGHSILSILHSRLEDAPALASACRTLLVAHHSELARLADQSRSPEQFRERHGVPLSPITPEKTYIRVCGEPSPLDRD